MTTKMGLRGCNKTWDKGQNFHQEMSKVRAGVGRWGL